MYLHANAKPGLAGRFALVEAIKGGMSLKAALRIDAQPLAPSEGEGPPAFPLRARGTWGLDPRANRGSERSAGWRVNPKGRKLLRRRRRASG
jgi:hypothetical protein